MDLPDPVRPTIPIFSLGFCAAKSVTTSPKDHITFKPYNLDIKILENKIKLGAVARGIVTASCVKMCGVRRYG